MKILIGLPVYKLISVRTVASLIALLEMESENRPEVIFQNGVYVHNNRNDLVDYAVEKGFDYLLFIDHDMIFEPRALEKLLR